MAEEWEIPTRHRPVMDVIADIESAIEDLPGLSPSFFGAQEDWEKATAP